MHRMIYTSSATRLPNEQDLQTILASSRKNNARDGITGMLLYHDGAFLQVLEGDIANLETCYGRIVRDLRHTGCIKMLSHAAPSRMFGEWQMAYQSYQGLGDRQQRQVMDIHKLASRLKGGEVEGHPAVMAVIMAFMSSFREFEMVG